MTASRNGATGETMWTMESLARRMVSSRCAREVGSVGPLSRGGAIGVLHIAAPCEAGGLERVVHPLAIARRRGCTRVCVFSVVSLGRAAHPVLAPLIAAGPEAVRGGT